MRRKSQEVLPEEAAAPPLVEREAELARMVLARRGTSRDTLASTATAAALSKARHKVVAASQSLLP